MQNIKLPVKGLHQPSTELSKRDWKEVRVTLQKSDTIECPLCFAFNGLPAGKSPYRVLHFTGFVVITLGRNSGAKKFGGSLAVRQIQLFPGL